MLFRSNDTATTEIYTSVNTLSLHDALPILPGIMPVTSPGRLRRILELSGEELPSELAIQLEVEPTAEGQREIGIDHAVTLARKLIAGGAPGLHLYAFNQHETVLAVLDRAGALAPGRLAPAPLSVPPTLSSPTPSAGVHAGTHSTKDY